MGTQEVSRDSFVWGHFGTILFHLIIAILLIYWSKIDINHAKLKKYIFYVGVVLFIVSILALVPIFSHYDDGHVYRIEMD